MRGGKSKKKYTYRNKGRELITHVRKMIKCSEIIKNNRKNVKENHQTNETTTTIQKLVIVEY